MPPRSTGRRPGSRRPRPWRVDDAVAPTARSCRRAAPASAVERRARVAEPLEVARARAGRTGRRSRDGHGPPPPGRARVGRGTVTGRPVRRPRFRRVRSLVVAEPRHRPRTSRTRRPRPRHRRPPSRAFDRRRRADHGQAQGRRHRARLEPADPVQGPGAARPRPDAAPALSRTLPSSRGRPSFEVGRRRRARPLGRLTRPGSAPGRPGDLRDPLPERSRATPPSSASRRSSAHTAQRPTA